METTCRKTGARLALVFAVPSLIPARASAQIRTATTTLAVKVERHGAIVLPADGEALARTALTGGNSSEVSAAARGNGSPRLITILETTSTAPVSASRARVAVTVFEP